MPQCFCQSFLVPIVKEKRGDVTDVDNYRGIAISSVTSKLLEIVLLQRLQNILWSTDQQFGFKRGHSCSDCSFVLKESIKYYLERGNQAMYCSSLDLSKAYDRVSYYKLFRKLLDIGCPVYCVRLLYTWY